MPVLLKVADIIVDKDIYPRFEVNNSNVESCRAGIDNLPPILVARFQGQYIFDRRAASLVGP